MQVKFDGSPIEVKGSQTELGQKAPDAVLLNKKGEKVNLHDVIDNKVTIISVIPNVLTRTCELQTQNFAETTKDKGYQYITVSRNTVDEFNNWNTENELDVDTYTDQDHEFGKAYGLDIELDGNDLLARAVIVVDQEGTIKYQEIVEEVTLEPNYKDALAIAENL